jgi:hypothetical protein
MIQEWGLWVSWWGRWDLNPGSHAPQACILIQNRSNSTGIHPSNPIGLSMLDDGPTQLTQKRAEEHAKHGFYLNLDESLAYQDYNQRIINTLEMMLANGLKLNTRRQVCNTLRQLNRHVDLMNTDAVKTCIATMTKKNKDGTTESISDASKQKKANNYDYFVTQNGLSWKKPFYVYDLKVPMTPTETQANEIISAAPTLNMATVFRILLESGFEGQELNNATEADIGKLWSENAKLSDKNTSL